ncbi:hypothetical protein AB0N16_15220 [Streptomyces sp. NPDC051105]|uniref:hypothetical protein n=1 Tax=Streptomyces sp. NPDC051105 TaxID=3154843 RepID=UPI003431F39E
MIRRLLPLLLLLTAAVAVPQLSKASPDPASVAIAYEKDPANHIALRHHPSLTALLTGAADRAFDAPRTRSRCAEGTPDITAVHGDTEELTGHYRADCATDRQPRATLLDFTVWRAHADQRPDLALPAWGTAGNIGDRSRIELMGHPLVLIKGQRLRDFGSWSAYVYDPASGRADRLHLRTPGGSGALANRRPRGSPTPTAVRPSWSASSSRRRSPLPASPANSSTGANCEGRAHPT